MSNLILSLAQDGSLVLAAGHHRIAAYLLDLLPGEGRSVPASLRLSANEDAIPALLHLGKTESGASGALASWVPADAPNTINQRPVVLFPGDPWPAPAVEADREFLRAIEDRNRAACGKDPLTGIEIGMDEAGWLYAETPLGRIGNYADVRTLLLAVLYAYQLRADALATRKDAQDD